MIGLDTNIVVRLFVDDDLKHANVARTFVAEHCTSQNPGYVNRVTLCELVWVLASVYRFKRAAVADVIERMLTARDIHVEDRAMAQAALATFRATSVDFTDALVGESNRARGCTATATFDRKAAKLDGFVRVG